MSGAAEEPSDGSPADEVAPEITDLAGVPAADTFAAGEDAPPAFTPNGDGLSDTLSVAHTASEPAHLDFKVRDLETDELVRSFTVWTEGRGRLDHLERPGFEWHGRAGRPVCAGGDSHRS